VPRQCLTTAVTVQTGNRGIAQLVYQRAVDPDDARRLHVHGELATETKKGMDGYCRDSVVWVSLPTGLRRGVPWRKLSETIHSRR
jgi:hypothetical protein